MPETDVPSVEVMVADAVAPNCQTSALVMVLARFEENCIDLDLQREIGSNSACKAHGLAIRVTG